MRTPSVSPAYRQSQSVGRGVLLLAAVAANIATTACHDLANGAGDSRKAERPMFAQLVVEPPTTGDSVVGIAIRLVGVDSPRVASVTAEITYDTIGLRFLMDGSPTDGALRAAHAERGRVIVAAAHATGFPGDVPSRLRFVLRDTSALGTMSLRLRELHLLDATDGRARMTVAPTTVVR